MHQLYTVGIEVVEITDYVTAAMPTTAEGQAWNLPDGTPLLWVRRISIDTNDQVVEVSDAQYPADRTMLTFHTPLTPWDADQ
jgi:GntR family transcriptional regulator